MDVSQIITYSVALGIAAAIPGPGITALVARSVSTGSLTGFAMLAGLILGDLTYLSFAVFGLALLAQSFNIFFIMVKWGSALYLAYLGWQFWHANHHAIDNHILPSKKDVLSAGLSRYSITLGNPKTIAFYLALLPVIIDLDAITWQSWALALVPVTMLVLIVVGSVFIVGALAIRNLLSSYKAQLILHRGAAIAMVAAAASMIFREL